MFRWGAQRPLEPDKPFCPRHLYADLWDAAHAEIGIIPYDRYVGNCVPDHSTRPERPAYVDFTTAFRNPAFISAE